MRLDLGCGDEIQSWRRHLAAGKSLTVSLGACSVVIDERNIDLLCARQLLVWARKSNA